MPRTHSLVGIVGAVALVPLGVIAGRIAGRVLVEPVAQGLPGTLLYAVKDLVGYQPPTAKAFLDTSEVADVPGARKLEHLFIVDSAAGRAPGSYQARTVPVFANGACQGVRFADVAPGSVYANLGIRTDDLIRRIDGEPIYSPEQALEIYSRLLQRRRVEVELERLGRPALEVYRID